MLSHNVIQHGSYKIQRIQSQPFPIEKHPLSFLWTNMITWGLWIGYMITQNLFILHMWSTSSSRSIWRLWIASLAEILLTMPDLLFGYNAIVRGLNRVDADPRPHYRLLEDQAPSVDVFVTCCGESLEIILNTITAAAHQDYPADQFRVLVLDDGKDEKLKQAVQHLDSTLNDGPRIHYLSRSVPKGQHSYFKAGNLQFGIEESARMGPSEFIASLDADVISHPGWLRHMVPPMILDRKMGMTSPPQLYYNIPPGDPLGQQAELDFWWTIFEPLNDHIGAASCNGTGFVVRRQALEEIGGWPLLDVGEDIMCSTTISQHGRSVALIREYLQYGIAPESYAALLKQKIRWFDCAAQVHARHGFYLTRTRENMQMPWLQRVTLMLRALRIFAPIGVILALVLLPISLTTLYPANAEFLSISRYQYQKLNVMFLLSYVAAKVNDYIMCRHVGLLQLSNLQSVDIWSSPYTAIRALRVLIPSATSKIETTVAGTFSSNVKERSLSNQLNAFQRVFQSGLLLHLLYAIGASLALSSCLYQIMILKNTDQDDIGMLQIFLFPGAVVKMASCIWKAAVPVIYMAFPPTVSEWRGFLEKDSRGVMRPKQEVQAIMDPASKPTDYKLPRMLRDAFEVGVLLYCIW